LNPVSKYDRSKGWIFSIHNTPVTLKEPEVGQRVRILCDDKKPGEHLVFGLSD
jgi:hypothetical protein